MSYLKKLRKSAGAGTNATVPHFLIMGDANSTFVKEHIEYTLLPRNCKVSIFCGWGNTTYAEFYKNNGVSIYDMPPAGAETGVDEYGQKVLEMFRDVNIDVVIVHFAYATSLVASMFLKKYSPRPIKSILVFWGSDMLRVGQNEYDFYRQFFPWTDIIIAASKRLLDKFHEVYGDEYEKNLHQFSFGLSKLDGIKRLMKVKTNYKEEMGLPTDKITVAIGYGRTPAHQHLKVLESIGKLTQDERDSMHIVLRMTYGNGDNVYVESLREKMDELGLKGTIYLDYMDDETVCKLSLAADMMVHAQISDSFSGSVQEWMMGGAIVINGAWIPYKELKERKLFYFEYEDFDELTKVISENLYFKETAPYRDKLKDNMMKIYNLSSWKARKKQWDAIYSL